MKVPSWKVRRNLDREFENPVENPVGNPVENDAPVENDEDFDTEEEEVVDPVPKQKKKKRNQNTIEENDADTEVSDDETEWKPKKRKRRAKKRPEYQNTLNLMWGRFRLSLTLIALVINTVCEDLGITDRSKYVSVTRLANLLKKFDENLLAIHAENNFGFPDCGKNELIF